MTWGLGGTVGQVTWVPEDAQTQENARQYKEPRTPGCEDAKQDRALAPLAPFSAPSSLPSQLGSGPWLDR